MIFCGIHSYFLYIHSLDDFGIGCKIRLMQCKVTNLVVTKTNSEVGFCDVVA